jgi:hypothetical protein
MLDLKKPLAVVLFGSLAALAACNKREAPAQVNADVARAEAAKAENVSDALVDQAVVEAKTSADAVSVDPDNRGSAIEERAEEAYKVALAKAEGDMKIATQACDALASGAQPACKQKAEGVYDVAKAQAKATLDNAKAQGAAVQKLDNK